MQNTLNFFVQINKLKTIRRTGWVKRGVKNPETIAQHKFRVALMNWLVADAAQAPLNLEKVIKISLTHDLCEVYAGDITPYWGLLPDDPKQAQEMMRRWLRLPRDQKEQRSREKFKHEYQAIIELTAHLPEKVKQEIQIAWLDYEKLATPEGRFVRQGDKVETLLQAIEYFGSGKDSFSVAWWEEIEDLVDDPSLRKFVSDIEQKFYHKKESDPILAFLLEVGRLKKLARRGWAARRIRGAETVADHSFTVALMVWVLGQGRGFDLEKAIKIALIHEICAVYAGDYTPHDVFGRGPFKWRNWKSRPRLDLTSRQARFLEKYQEETRALQRLIANLPKKLKHEILELWHSFVSKNCKEADFVDQVNCLATFLQAIEYWQKDKRFDIRTFIEGVIEFVHEPKLLALLGAIAKRFELDKIQPATPGFSLGKTIADYIGKAKAVVGRK